MSKTIIIGAGASGLIAAIIAKRNNEDVLLLERNTTCGKKLLITGNGRCNYFNDDQDLRHYHSSNKEVLKEIITSNNLNKVLEFFNSIGIIPQIKNGYYYPYSNQAVSIQNSLLSEIKSLNIKVETNTYVKSVEHKNNKFLIKTDDKEIIANKLIIATGSKSAPKTGSDGNGYDLAKKLGHSIIKPLPALVQLNINEPFLKEWSGIRANVSIKLIEDDKYIKQEQGEILLTNYGISGICVMQLSSKISRGLYEGKTEEVIINFLDGLISTRQEFIAFMNERDKKLPNRNITQLLDSILNYKLINVLVKKSNLQTSKKWSQLSSKEKSVMASNFIELRLKITSTNSFEKAQVTSGGVPLNEINPLTLESTIVKKLYFAGEILDVDGDCGGYNLTFAWISGILTGSSRGNKND